MSPTPTATWVRSRTQHRRRGRQFAERPQEPPHVRRRRRAQPLEALQDVGLQKVEAQAQPRPQGHLQHAREDEQHGAQACGRAAALAGPAAALRAGGGFFDGQRRRLQVPREPRVLPRPLKLQRCAVVETLAAGTVNTIGTCVSMMVACLRAPAARTAWWGSPGRRAPWPCTACTMTCPPARHGVSQMCAAGPRTDAGPHHGRLRLVRLAPPAMAPLCCRMRRGGLTVNPMYVWSLKPGACDTSR